uniref:Uncharacterized protein n=1 Tax=Meloidogyne enterolobii TaxID=390850 RepID=A0A6V7X9D5_MELEN|nr:unnamed protein product [Meloidogyne enterolobii]
MSKSWDITPLLILQLFIGILANFAEILIICFIGGYSMKKYKNTLIKSGINYSLNEKSQLSENIRTSNQLFPVFICHFIRNLSIPIVAIEICLNMPSYIINIIHH